MARTKYTQESFTKHVMKFVQDKTAIQTSIDKGATLQELSVRYNIVPATLKRMLGTAGIQLRLQNRKNPPGADILNALMKVVIRLADDLKVDRSELDDYIQ